MERLNRQVTEHLIGTRKGVQRGDEVQALCPFRTEKSPSFSYNTRKLTYFCFGCQVKGHLVELAKHLGFSVPDRKQPSGDHQRPPDKAYSHFHKSLSKQDIEYWTGRGIVKESLAEGKIGVMKTYTGILCDTFPYFDAKGEFIVYKTVAREKKDRSKNTFWTPKGKGAPLYGRQYVSFYMEETPLILCEGEKDFWILKQAGFQVLAVSGAQTYSQKNNALLKDFDIYILFDYDKSGYDGSINVLRKLKHGKLCDWALVDTKKTDGMDVTDLFLQSPDDFERHILYALEFAKNPFESELERTVEKATIEENYKQLHIIRVNHALIQYEKKKAIATYIFDQLSLAGKWYYTRELEFYYFSTDTKELFSLYGTTFQLLLYRLFGVNRAGTDFEFTLFELKGKAQQVGQETEIRQVCHYVHAKNLLYVFDNAFSIYRISATKIEKYDNGVDNVLFLKDFSSEAFEVDISSLPVPAEKRGVLDIIFENPNFSKNSLLSPEQAKIVFSFWFFYIFFLDYYPSKPFLALLGEKGSAKTMSLKLIRIFFYGLARKDVYMLGEHKKEAEDYVVNNFLWFFDGVDEKLSGRRSWTMTFLTSLSTGVEVSRRKHYENRDMWHAVPHGIPAITSRTPYFTRDDVPDRLLILQLDRREDFLPDSELYDRIVSHRDELWTAVLSELQDMIRAMEQPYKGKIQFRLADFAHFCYTVAHAENQLSDVQGIFKKLAEAQTELTLLDDPIFQVLELWMADTSNHGMEFSTKELWRKLKDIAEAQSIEYFPKSSVSLGKRLSSLKSNLKNYYQISQATGRSRKVSWVFRSL